MNNEAHDELISAALDGERVDLEALRGALASPDGRATLAAFVMLRAATAADDIPLPVEPRRAVDAEALHAARLARPRVSLAWAASIAIVAVATSFWFGTSLRPPIARLTLLAPPPVSLPATTPRVVMVPTATNDAGASAQTTQRPDRARPIRVADQPPKPTRMLRFVPGVDWISTAQ